MINIVAIGVTHWHSLYDAAYLPLLQQMPDVRIVRCTALPKKGGQARIIFLGASRMPLISLRPQITLGLAFGNGLSASAVASVQSPRFT